MPRRLWKQKPGTKLYLIEIVILLLIICVSITTINSLSKTIDDLSEEKNHLQAIVDNKQIYVDSLRCLLEQINSASQRYSEQYRLLLQELVGWDYWWENIDPLVGGTQT